MKKAFIMGGILCCSGIFCQERYADICGQKFRIRELGKGEITVVFESGMSDSLEVWGGIPDSVANYARVFLYDRADIGKSDNSVTERTIPNVLLELKTLLKDQRINPPYILVGHSLGGLIVRYFAGNCPGEVRGLLLLDPAPESYWNGMPEDELKEYIRGGNEWYENHFAEKYRKEWYQFIPNLAYMNNLNIDRQMPVILVSATAWNWYGYHEDIIKGFEHARHVELEGEHHIYKDHPGLIVEYIKELLKTSVLVIENIQ
jgi:pimeloyl-ACP methyl ester carboxylesterase